MSVEVDDATQRQVRLDELTNEILDLICSHAMNRDKPYPRSERNPLDGFSRASKFLNNICAPHHFRVVSICSSWELRKAATILNECERFRNHTKRLKINIFPNKASVKDELWNYKFTSATAYDLYSVMGPVCWKLEELHLSLRLPYQGLAQDLRSTLRRHKGRVERMPHDNPRVTLNMPRLRKLIVGNYCEFILDQCPNVEAVSSNGAEFIKGFHEDDSICFGSSRLVENLIKLKRLRHLELDAAWDCFQVCRLMDILQPIGHQIESLALLGSLSYEATKRVGDNADQDNDQEFYNSTAEDAMDQVLHDGFTSGFWESGLASTASDIVQCHIQDFGYNSWLRTRHIRAICRKSLNAFRLPNLKSLTLPEIPHLGCQYRRPVSTDPPSWAALDLERVHPTRWGQDGVIPRKPYEILVSGEDGTPWYPSDTCIATMAMECAEYLTDIIGTESDPESESETDGQTERTEDKKKTPKTGLQDPWMFAEHNFITIVEGDITWLAASVVAEECCQVEQVWFGDHVQITVMGVVMMDGKWVLLEFLPDDHPKKYLPVTEAYTLKCTRRTEDGKVIIRNGVFMQKARNPYRW